MLTPYARGRGKRAVGRSQLLTVVLYCPFKRALSVFYRQIMGDFGLKMPDCCSAGMFQPASLRENVAFAL